MAEILLSRLACAQLVEEMPPIKFVDSHLRAHRKPQYTKGPRAGELWLGELGLVDQGVRGGTAR